MNFIETMALHRAFSGGRFRCSGASPVIKVGDFPSEGYVLVIRKSAIKKFCLGCIKNFIASKPPLRANENKNYLVIYSS